MAMSVKLDDNLKKRLQQLAATSRRLPLWIIREAVEQYVQREEARVSFLEETQASWEEYQTPGQHLTGDEVRKWLATWGTEAETEIPACHE